jgi:hypothetical protein
VVEVTPGVVAAAAPVVFTSIGSEARTTVPAASSNLNRLFCCRVDPEVTTARLHLDQRYAVSTVNAPRQLIDQAVDQNFTPVVQRE